MGFFTGYDWRAISVYASGIKCDSCPHSEPLVKSSEYKNYLNRPCPICGENLLTKKDYDMVRITSALQNIFNVILAPMIFLKFVFSSEYRTKMREGTLYGKYKWETNKDIFEKVEE